MIREAVGVFDNPEELNAAVVELEITAFPRDAISVLGKAATLKKKFGIPYMRHAEDNPDVPRDILVRPEEKTILLSALVGMGIYAALTAAVLALGSAPTAMDLSATLVIAAAVALMGALLTRRLLSHYRMDRDGQIHAGGTVLWVRTPEPEQEDIARIILRKHGAKDVHIHAIN